MSTPSSHPPEPSLDAIEGRATFDGHVIRLERWRREADRRRCAYAAAPIGSVRGVQVMTTPDAAFLVIDVVAPDGKATGIPTRPRALARSVWTLRVPDPVKAARFADMVARHAPKEAVPLERAPRADRRPVLLIAVAAMLAAALAVLGGWTTYEAGPAGAGEDEGRQAHRGQGKDPYRHIMPHSDSVDGAGAGPGRDDGTGDGCRAPKPAGPIRRQPKPIAIDGHELRDA